ncbi:MAG: hypothetical protein R8G01_13530 [Ilumatobacteraceae bacterium]|nr:hypothetical protein [Ilumatobacteraceae bacterium]
MNITNVLHRSRTGGGDVTRVTRPVAPQPHASPPTVFSLERGTRSERAGRGRRDGSPWPKGGVVLVALLAIAAVLGAVGTAAGFASGDDDSTERELRGQVATLTSERGAAIEAVAVLDAELVSLRELLFAAQGGADDLAGQVGTLQARVAALTDQRSTALASIDALDAELTLAQQELAATQQRLTDVTADRDRFARLFPMTFDASLDAVDLVGVHRVDATRIYCAGLTTCGAAPSISDVTIRSTPEGYLRANIPGLVEGGLFRADGALHLVADSNLAVPSCAGAARTASVTMTIFPGGVTAGRDGTSTITGLNAVITVEAPAVGTCPAVLAFSSAELTARA